MKVICDANGFRIATDQGVICHELPIFMSEQQAANWLVKVNTELLRLVMDVKFDVQGTGNGRRGTTLNFCLSKQRGGNESFNTGSDLNCNQ